MRERKFIAIYLLILLLTSGLFLIGCDDSTCVDGKCPTCSGRGYLNYSGGGYAGKCHSCKGTGLHSKCGGKGCGSQTGNTNNPNSPYNNNEAKIIRVQNLPYTGDWILMLSTGTNLNPEAFDNGVFAIGFTTATNMLGYTSFPLKIGTIESGPSSINYTGTGDFYIALYHKNQKTWWDCINSATYGGNANTLKIETGVTDAIRMNIWNWKSVDWDWYPDWWPFD